MSTRDNTITLAVEIVRATLEPFTYGPVKDLEFVLNEARALVTTEHQAWPTHLAAKVIAYTVSRSGENIDEIFRLARLRAKEEAER